MYFKILHISKECIDNPSTKKSLPLQEKGIFFYQFGPLNYLAFWIDFFVICLAIANYLMACINIMIKNLIMRKANFHA